MQKTGTTRKRPRVLAAILLAIVVVLASLCVCLFIRLREVSVSPEAALPHGNGLFSWHDEIFEEDEREILFSLMRENGLTELYQDVPSDTPAPVIKDFTDACAENGVKLYLLIGDPEWALDKNGYELRAQIQRAALMGFAGGMVDVEPGSTSAWKKDRAPVMETMTKSFLRGKEAAEENGVEMIVCLSYYYDDYGFESELGTIIGQGCDALAVMNYNRDDEIGQIEHEASLCRKYGKRLINIYELKEAGKYGLEESHTYREEGFDALNKSAETLRRYFSGQDFNTALHDYRALKEMSGS